MSWNVLYHPGVREDLEALGPVAASRALKAIDQRIHRGEPGKLGKPLRGDLARCRRLRVGDIRIVYHLDVPKKEALILAVGPRRHEEVYENAGERKGS